MIDWSKGLSARYYATFIDPKTWRDIGTFDFISGSISVSNSGTRGSADIKCKDFDSTTERWIRIYMDARQGDNAELVPLFTGMASLPSINYEGRLSSNNVQCYSVLSPAEKILLPLGWYVHPGANGAATIKDLISDSTFAPIIIENESPILSESIVAESNESRLSMIDKILNAMNWQMKIDGDGTIRLSENIDNKKISDYIKDTFDNNNNDIFELSLTMTNDWFNVPNVFRAVGSGVTAISRDEDPNSPFSIPRRGREIWMEEHGCVLKDNEKISTYADRRLKEEQNVHKTIDYSRRFKPGINIGDIVKINYPEQKVSGIFRIKSQSLTIGYGISVSEQVEEV